MLPSFRELLHVANAELATKPEHPGSSSSASGGAHLEQRSTWSPQTQLPSLSMLVQPTRNTTHLTNNGGTVSPSDRSPVLGSSLSAYAMLQQQQALEQQRRYAEAQSHSSTSTVCSRHDHHHHSACTAPDISSSPSGSVTASQRSTSYAATTAGHNHTTLPSVSHLASGCAQPQPSSRSSHQQYYAGMPAASSEHSSANWRVASTQPSSSYSVQQHDGAVWQSSYPIYVDHRQQQQQQQQQHHHHHEMATPPHGYHEMNSSAMLAASLVAAANQARMHGTTNPGHLVSSHLLHSDLAPVRLPSAEQPPSMHCGKRKPRNIWSNQEDVVLYRLVRKHGPRRWQRIALKLRKAVPTCDKDGTQCSQHWRRVLAPRLQRSGIKNGLKTSSSSA